MMSKIIDFFKKSTVQKDILVLSIFIITCIAVNLPACLSVTSDMAKLNVLSLDEWAYADFLNTGFYSTIDHGNYKEIFLLRDNWGYGTLFWYAYGLIGMSFHYLSSFSATIIALRIFSAFWLAICLYFIYKIIYFLRRSYLNAVLGALFIFTMPAYYFYMKAFSAEFITSAFALASLYFLLIDKQKFKRNYLFSIFLLAIAIGLKLSIIIFVPVYLVHFFCFVWKRKLKSILVLIVKIIIIAIIGFALCNPYIVFSKPGLDHYKMITEQNINDNKTGHGGNSEYVTLTTWYTDGISKDYMPLPILIIIIFAYTIQIFNKKNENRFSLLMIFALFLFNLFYIVLTVNKIWTWYLFPTFFISMIGLFTLNFKKNIKIEKIILIAILLTLFIINFKVIQGKYVEMLSRETTPQFKEKALAKMQFDQWLSSNNYHDVRILKYPYIYFDETLFNNIKVYPYWGPLKGWHFLYYQPDILLIDNVVHQEMANSPDQMYNILINDGLYINGEFFKYQLALDTTNFKVFTRIK